MKFIIPPIFKSPRITNLINSQIDYGYTSYSSLDHIDKELITAECIALLGDDAYEYIKQADSLNNMLFNLSSYFKTSDKDVRYDLMESLRENATKLYEDELNMLFDELLADRNGEIQEEVRLQYGHRHFYAADNGEQLCCG